MRSLNLLLFCALPVILLGCSSTPETPYFESAKEEMIGMTKAEMPTCLGQPAKKAVTGSVETWSYNYGSCTVNLTIAGDGKVMAVSDTYQTVPTKKDDDLLPEDEQCAKIPEVAGCVRWLRR